ncbi:MAG: site-specific integrase [Clostridia bacterium]|nr:site-specific integrase [Clostridia bacterium]
MKYKDWLSEWLENYVKPSSKQRTYTRYCEIVNQHIQPRLGILELDKMSAFELQRFVTELVKNGNLKTGKGLSVNSVNAIITVVQNSLKTAHMLGYSKVYDGDKIKRPKASERKVECFTKDEQQRIEKYILNLKSYKLYGIVLCLYTGLRIGELLALEWQDIDFKKEEMRVYKACYDGKDDKGKFTRIVDRPKTECSNRIVPLPRQIIPLLRDMKKSSKSNYVISNNGKGIFVRSYQRSFELLLKKLGIEHKGFHSLRHTFATRALECGMDVKTLSEILGHKNPNVTLNRYAHSLMEHKKSMMNKLGRLCLA